jgi:hypothetical protein
MTFDLRQHIRTILAETSEENLDTLTSLIFDRTPKSATREAYRQALTEVVRKELATAPRAPKHDSDSRLDQSRADAHEIRIEPGSTSAGEGHPCSDTQIGRTLPGGNLRNSRTALFRRNRWRISVWIGDKTYRNILDCTRADLEFAAEESHRQAEANAATERRYRRLAKLMADRGVDTVAELSDEEIWEVMSGE